VQNVLLVDVALDLFDQAEMRVRGRAVLDFQLDNLVHTLFLKVSEKGFLIHSDEDGFNAWPIDHSRDAALNAKLAGNTLTGARSKF
jgi:hypothetical protein